MNTIVQLLNEYGSVSSIFGAKHCSVNQGRRELIEAANKRVAARAAVDAKVKELQDRIAELERENEELKGLLEE